MLCRDEQFDQTKRKMTICNVLWRRKVARVWILLTHVFRRLNEKTRVYRLTRAIDQNVCFLRRNTWSLLECWENRVDINFVTSEIVAILRQHRVFFIIFFNDESIDKYVFIYLYKRLWGSSTVRAVAYGPAPEQGPHHTILQPKKKKKTSV